MGTTDKRLLSFKYAFTGLRHLILSQPNAKIHLLATIIVVSVGLYFQVTRLEWSVLVLTIAIVWIAEGLNTSVEWLSDRVTTDHDEIIAKVKDVAAGAVLVAAMAAVVIALLIFLPYLSL